MPIISLFGFASYAMPAGLTPSQIASSTFANAADAAKYDPNAPTWIGKTFTFNGGAPTQLVINDDDGMFTDGYVESGGSQMLAAPVTIGTTTYPAGSVVENEFSMESSTGKILYVVRIAGQNVGFTYPDGQTPAPGTSFVPVKARDGLTADSSNATGTSAVAYSGVICFAAGTRIATPGGPRRVEDLATGDPVTTAGSGPRPIRWIARTDFRFPPGSGSGRPVMIRAGSLGSAFPLHDLVVSPQHRILISGPAVLKHCGAREVLVPAVALVGLFGVREMRGCRQVTYVHLLLDSHEILFAEGVATESLYPGPSALRMLDPGRQVELLRQLAALGTEYGPLARTALARRQAERLIRGPGRDGPWIGRLWGMDEAAPPRPLAHALPDALAPAAAASQPARRP